MDRKTAAEAFQTTNVNIHKIIEKIDIKYDEKYSREKYSINNIQALIWLEKNGKKRLKDIAAQMRISTSSLCVMFNLA
ncbi:MAG: hypothetical protein LBP40_03180 [Campylobacteraceae bacterium]|nr:hypothetical protein [Campylobacteraceae bacterium]